MNGKLNLASMHLLAAIAFKWLLWLDSLERGDAAKSNHVVLLGWSLVFLMQGSVLYSQEQLLVPLQGRGFNVDTNSGNWQRPWPRVRIFIPGRLNPLVVVACCYS